MKNQLVACRPVVKDTITEGDAIIILAAILNHHMISPKEITALPEVNELGISELAVQNFLNSHGLVKKTPDSKP